MRRPDRRAFSRAARLASRGTRGVSTGDEIVAGYLEPLAATPELAGKIEVGTKVQAVSRSGLDKVVSRGRATRPFVLSVLTAEGLRRDLARVVIDASGTWSTPNPLGASGLAAEGEQEFAGRIAYGIPDVLGRDRSIYAGRTTLVVGSGHSAANAMLDLAGLAETAPGTSIIWVTRGTDLARVYGGGDADQLPARGELGSGVRNLVEGGRVPLVSGFAATAVREESGRLSVDGQTSDGPRRIGSIDRIIVATGASSRPDRDARIAARSRSMA